MMDDTLVAQRPPYATVDFKTLASQDKHFNEIWQMSSGRLDFHDPDTVRRLTKAILKVDFGLLLEIPDDRLCPPVPNRWNYVTWIQGLLDSTSPDYSNGYDPDRKVVGLDIGTGASAIYAMLCLKARPSWTMCATDVDKKSFDSAARNLALNNLLSRTKMLQTTELNNLIPLKYLGVERLDFTICNPPFFEDERMMQASLKGEGKGSKPNAICTGAEVEMVCPGGDLGFVTRIVEESLVLREKVTWYSSMLGKMSSAKSIIDLLKKNAITNWAVGSIEVGGPTKRWVVAWSFGDLRPKNSIVRLDTIANEYLPFPTSYIISLSQDQNLQSAKDTVNGQLSSLDMQWTWSPEDSTGIGAAAQNVWKRAYRREHERRKREGVEDMADADTDAKNKNGALVFRIRVIDPARQLTIDWLKGTDQVLWESFCGLIHRSFKKS